MNLNGSLDTRQRLCDMQNMKQTDCRIIQLNLFLLEVRRYD